MMNAAWTKIKRIVLLLCVYLSCEVVRATEHYRDSVYSLGGQVEYAYNHIYRHYAMFSVDAFMPINPYFNAKASMLATTANTYVVHVCAQPRFPLRMGELYLQTDLLYNAYASARYHGLAGAFSFGYRFDYLDVMVGYGARLMASFDIDFNTLEHGIFEPHNFVYRLAVSARPYTSFWNVTAYITNLTDYQMERVLTPMFGLDCHVDVLPNLRIAPQVLIKPVGILNSIPSFFGAECGVNVQYLFTKEKNK